MSMEVITLGTGTLTPQPRRASSCLAIVEDAHVLCIDLGRNALSRMVEAGIDVFERDAFLLTHLHPDHSAELVSLLFAMNYAPEPARTRPLALIGPGGLRRLVERLVEAWSWLAPKYPLEIVEIGPGTTQVEGFEVEAVRMHHGITENLGYRVRSPRSGLCVAFTGDTGPGPALEQLARGVDLLVAECSHDDATPSEAHLSPTYLAEAARRAGVRSLLLTHLLPGTEPGTVLAQVAAVYPGPVGLARDGLRRVVA